MARETTRGGASQHGGGPYANAAAEFLSLAARLADPDGSVIGLVLPQSVLAARDAGPVRRRVDELADHTWSWWEPDQRHLFDAAVNVCALGFRRPSTGADSAFAWTQVVTGALGIPPIDPSMIEADGTIGDRADLNANFRDEYYALVGAVSDDADGPIFITSGLIDPGRSLWGERNVTFAKQSYRHPRVDLTKLDGRFPAWAQHKLVPKVLVANQTVDRRSGRRRRGRLASRGTGHGDHADRRRSRDPGTRPCARSKRSSPPPWHRLGAGTSVGAPGCRRPPCA